MATDHCAGSALTDHQVPARRVVASRNERRANKKEGESWKTSARVTPSSSTILSFGLAPDQRSGANAPDWAGREVSVGPCAMARSDASLAGLQPRTDIAS